MHRIAFDLKRGHLRTVAYGERVMKGIPRMTAARFDLLCLIRQKQLWQGRGGATQVGVTQHEIWKVLDLSKQTISKMLCRLEELGWVKRVRASHEDWRSRVVFLTDMGLGHIAKAMRIMFRQRTFLRYFERIYKAVEPYASTHPVRCITEMSGHIRFVADAFGDRSHVFYDTGRSCSDGRWSPRTGRNFHPLYQPAPPPRLPPVPLKGDARDTCRPLVFTEYENNIRAFLWNMEKRPRRRKVTVPDEPFEYEEDGTDDFTPL